MPDMILVHADGGPCHGCPIENGRCVGCGEAPDTQSTELRRFVTMAARVPYRAASQHGDEFRVDHDGGDEHDRA